MLGNIGAQQLVGTQSQKIEQHRVDLFDRSIRCRRDDSVEQAAAATGSIGQLGGERGVTAADAALGQQGR